MFVNNGQWTEVGNLYNILTGYKLMYDTKMMVLIFCLKLTVVNYQLGVLFCKLIQNKWFLIPDFHPPKHSRFPQ